jgi:hypothetical protein
MPRRDWVFLQEILVQTWFPEPFLEIITKILVYFLPTTSGGQALIRGEFFFFQIILGIGGFPSDWTLGISRF